MRSHDADHPNACRCCRDADSPFCPHVLRTIHRTWSRHAANGVPRHRSGSSNACLCRMMTSHACHPKPCIHLKICVLRKTCAPRKTYALRKTCGHCPGNTLPVSGYRASGIVRRVTRSCLRLPYLSLSSLILVCHRMAYVMAQHPGPCVLQERSIAPRAFLPRRISANLP